VPPDERWAEGRLVLPGGVLDAAGTVHPTVRISELTGRDEEVLSERRYDTGAAQVTDLLAQVIQRVEGLERAVDRDLAADMLVGDRDYVVLRLRQITNGDEVHEVLRCPNPGCAQQVDVDFLISEFPVRRAEHVAARYDLTLSRPVTVGGEHATHCVLRLPTGRDQEAVLRLGEVNPARANTALLGRLLLRIGRVDRIDEDLVRDLPLTTRQEMLDFIRRTAPGPILDVDIQCPYCSTDISYPFDLSSFFFSEWSMRLDVLYRQVHHLALHYHWSETEILGMTRAKRERYLALLAQHLEAGEP
jgi:hypothetical protein